MYYIRERTLAGEFMAGTWCSLGSAIAAEIAGLAGYDWVLLDSEHAPSTAPGLMAQMQALSRFPTAPVVRIPWLDQVYVKWALDMGASGIMVPYVETAEQAAAAVSCMRYSPQGIRGLGTATRASDYGYDFPDYFSRANRELLAVVQVETVRAVDNAAAIAAVDGVGVLFVGPMDLGNNGNMPGKFSDPRFMEMLRRVAAAARGLGKACGILLPDTNLVPALRAIGYTFIAVGSDSGLLTRHFRENLAAMRSPLASAGAPARNSA
ncbi:MAG: 2,4-dihydroxyhept-2-ene-1,7-dioic acid aldolase [Desulfovibrio sp.]|jgi:2-keto-3-deoxy-L-rhamnonate aldolase RhmA|nr:2,4-dihydroxyhept-2-ene-1,7-dioic acid aldolase [Desulfovibrio sp.]